MPLQRKLRNGKTSTASRRQPARQPTLAGRVVSVRQDIPDRIGTREGYTMDEQETYQIAIIAHKRICMELVVDIAAASIDDALAEAERQVDQDDLGLDAFEDAEHIETFGFEVVSIDPVDDTLPRQEES